MFNKYDYVDLKLAEKYLKETEGFNVYYFNEFMNSNLDLIISGYIVLKRKWYTKELYEIEFEYNYNKKEFEMIFPSEFNNLFDKWELTENNTIFTKDYFLEKIQKYIDDIIRETVLGYKKNLTHIPEDVEIRDIAIPARLFEEQLEEEED